MHQDPRASDRSLLASYAAGERKAAELLLCRHQGALLGFLLRKLRDRDLAEEALQETFVRLLQSAARLVAHPRPEAWLFSVARNVAADIFRRRLRESPVTRPGLRGSADSEAADSEAGRAAPDGSRPEALLRSRELSGLVLRSIRQLPEAERRVFLLRTQALRSFREIAEEVGAPLNTVLSRMHRALKRIGGVLAGEGWIDPPHGGGRSS